MTDYRGLPAGDPLKAKLAGPIGVLRNWDCRWGIASIPTSIAVFWGDTLWNEFAPEARASGIDAHTLDMRMYDYIVERVSPRARLGALAEAVERLKQDFGTWGVPWGEINRHQRLDDSIHPHFSDSKPSIARPIHVLERGIVGFVRRTSMARYQEILRQRWQQLRRRR